jgi:hypothetical protein
MKVNFILHPGSDNRGDHFVRTISVLALRPDTLHLIPLLLVLSFTGTSVPGDVYAEDSQQQNAELYSGKTLDEWIGHAKTGRRLEDREDALQTLRNLGLRRDRDKTLRAFTELLSDKAPTIRSLAAAGLRKAGKPTDPKAAAKLVEIISQDLSGLKLPKKSGEVGAEFGGVVRAIAALEVIGERDHIAALKRVSENDATDSIIRQAADKAVRQIEKRANSRPADSLQAPAHDGRSGRSARHPNSHRVAGRQRTPGPGNPGAGSSRETKVRG